MFNLNDYRKNILSLSIEELATKLSVENDYLEHLEKNPEKIDLHFLSTLANAENTSIENLLNFKENLSHTLDIEDTWNTNIDLVQDLNNTISAEYSAFQIDEKLHLNIKNDIQNIVETAAKKPTVAVVGMSDAGKSKLINSLIGFDKMPTSWTPTTSISVYLKHINDKPNFLEDEVHIFNNIDGGFDITKSNTFSFYDQYVMASGTIELLSDFGTRQGSHFADNADTAIVYVDSSILKVCNIVDLPGFGTGDRENDDLMAKKSYSYADIIIYLSIANGFLRETDMEFIKNSINSLPVLSSPTTTLSPLQNLYVIASQAQTIGSSNEVDKILEVGAKRLYHEIPSKIWENRAASTGYSYSEEALKHRFFSYSTDKTILREKFESDLSTTLELLPKIINENTKKLLEDTLNSQKDKLKGKISIYNTMLAEGENASLRYYELKKNEPKRKDETYNHRVNTLNKINEFRNESIESFELAYSKIINTENIVDIIKSQGYKKKKDQIERLAGYISSTLQAELQSIINNKSQELATVVNSFLKDFDKSIKKNDTKLWTDISIPFDSLRIFASGLAGVATFGGLAIWASTLGNLGAYILVAKGVSVLSALGIGVAGGTAGAATAISSLGGPVTLGIVLSVIVSLSVFSLASGSWRKGVAKKIIKEYEKQEALNQFTEAIDIFWNDTEKEFTVAADYMEKQWETKLNDLIGEAESFNKEEIESNILHCKNLMQVLDQKLNSLPLSSMSKELISYE